MSKTSNMFSNNTNSNEAHTRYLQTRIDNLEKSLLDIHNSICAYTRKIARTRDEGDILAQNLIQFAVSEKINTSLKSGLSNFANCLSTIQDFRNDEVQKIEEKVINEISIYGENTKRAKEELRVSSNARNKQLSDQKEGKLKELARSTSFNEISTVVRAYELQAQKFELKKLCDLKKIFLEFTKNELLFHAKTLELLTKAYKQLLTINEEKDLEEFCTFFNFTQLNSPKRENSMKFSENEKIEISSTLRRFNSTPDFNTSNTSMTKRGSFDNNEKPMTDRNNGNVKHPYDSDTDSDDNYTPKGIKNDR